VAQAAALSCTAGLPNDEAEAVVQATWLASAVRRKSAGAAARMAVAHAANAEVHVPESRKMLERVARCYRRSPVVRTALEHEPIAGVAGRAALARHSS